MWVFFLGSVFFYFYLKNTKRYKNTLVIIMILVIIAGLIIVLQNMGVIPFLWSEAYRLAYLGFLSGTFGPNKIVLGMTMFISFVFLVGINTENKIQKSKILMYVAIGVSLLCIILSGSRTTYVGVIFFLLYFFFTKTGRFIFFAIYC
jgi:hypothetical protein